MSKKQPSEAPAKGGKIKKILFLTLGSTVLIGAGIGGGAYYTGGFTGKHEEENPNQPKLVLRGEEPSEPTEGEGGEAAPLKVGTVSVKNDQVKVDPKKYEITYIPLEQAFTSNLADGDGFVQVGLSLSTYYDGKVVGNIKRQMVPVRSAVLMVLSEQNAQVLSQPEGKVALQRRMTKAINEVLREKEGFGGIDNVYFSNLVIQ